jgi:LPS sulfotransferase NodH
MLTSNLAVIGEHEIALRKLFGDRITYGGEPVIDGSLSLLCFANRSGSNLLADYLVTIPGFAGFEEELNHDVVEEELINNNIIDSLPEYIKTKVTQTGGTYGFKANIDQLLMLYRCKIFNMYSGGARILHIVRKSRLDQAVSFSMAVQTGQWKSTDDVGSEEKSRFLFEDIDSRLLGSCLSNEFIPALCEIIDVPYFCVTYEELLLNPSQVVRNSAEFLEADVPPSWTPRSPSIRRQASTRNEEFVGDFRRMAQMIIGKGRV